MSESEPTEELDSSPRIAGLSAFVVFTMRSNIASERLHFRDDITSTCSVSHENLRGFHPIVSSLQWTFNAVFNQAGALPVHKAQIGKIISTSPAYLDPNPVAIVLTVRNRINRSSQGEKYLM